MRATRPSPGAVEPTRWGWRRWHQSVDRGRHTTVLAAADRRDVGQRLTPAGPEHAWRGRHLSAGWGVAEELELRTVKPDLVAEVVADTAVGRYRHPVRFVRLRDDLTPREALSFTA